MGYTHYFHDSVATPVVVAEAEKIIAATTVPLVGNFEGTVGPRISEADGIWLDGVAPDDYETFLLPSPHNRDRHEFGSVKTGMRPYDEVVVAILVAVILDGQHVSSDGGPAEWAPGIALFERAVRPLTAVESAELLMVLASRYAPLRSETL
ncbi:hypothetical protein [Nostocoides jenkinsii]|jgi:hypothetical protein|uniref:Uncharacterized protein n=1 Tax=Nostocoides jenkinsii Ben 74 TaxID=1193518 RepID=A0A077MF74_9MICO|nr:hypothetical protein [Tetrasphaera jenkinsii]CCI54675.1 conserved hypothetical protein [Tetrasphaera jenkinsii Ben 74]